MPSVFGNAVRGRNRPVAWLPLNGMTARLMRHCLYEVWYSPSSTSSERFTGHGLTEDLHRPNLHGLGLKDPITVARRGLWAVMLEFAVMCADLRPRKTIEVGHGVPEWQPDLAP